MTIKAISKYITPARLGPSVSAPPVRVSIRRAMGFRYRGCHHGLSAVSLPALADHAARRGQARQIRGRCGLPPSPAS